MAKKGINKVMNWFQILFMKKLIILAVFFLIGCDGEIDAVSFDLQEPDYEYEVDTWGSNSEVYEITPKSNANVSCLVFILDNVNDVAMQCFDKKLPNNKSGL